MPLHTSQDSVDSLILLATRLWRALLFALPGLPSNFQWLLKSRIADSEVHWALALRLAGEHLRERGASAIEALLKATGGVSLIGRIPSYRRFFEHFISEAATADSDYQSARAAEKLSIAIQAGSDSERSDLHGWLRSSEFYQTGRALILRFPPPGSTRPQAWGSANVTLTTAPPPVGSPPSRAQRFDRLDYRASQRPAPRTQSLPQRQSADLDDRAVSRAFLQRLGWPVEDVARFLAGPGNRETE